MELQDSLFSSVNLKKYPDRLLTLLGVTVEQFDFLFVSVKHQEFLRQSSHLLLWSEDRIARMVDRYSSVIREHLCITLLYLRQYNTQEVIATAFDLTQGQISKIISKISPLLADCLPIPEVMSQILSDRIEQMDSSIKESYSATLIIDASEQQIERNHDQNQQREDYSGKKNTIPGNFKLFRLKSDSS